MKFNEENIKKLKEGKATLVADHYKPMEMSSVLNYTFPDDRTDYLDFNDHKYFYHVFEGDWDVSNHRTKGELIELEDFFIEEPKEISSNSFSDILTSLGEMLRSKDKAYGNSALNPLDIFAKHHKYGSRIDEKLARVKNSDELRKNDVADIIGGLVLICRDKGWTDFKDQID